VPFPLIDCPPMALAMTPPSFLASSFLVALGGGLGAWLRFIAARLIPSAGFPFATLTVNLLGSFAMGLLVSALVRQGGNESARLLLGVGVLGGFTTFSAFSLEVVTLAQRGAIGIAALYAGLSLVGGVLGLTAGLALMKAAA
jgi:CrcB protein